MACNYINPAGTIYSAWPTFIVIISGPGAADAESIMANNTFQVGAEGYYKVFETLAGEFEPLSRFLELDIEMHPDIPRGVEARIIWERVHEDPELHAIIATEMRKHPKYVAVRRDQKS